MVLVLGWVVLEIDGMGLDVVGDRPCSSATALLLQRFHA